MAESSLRYNLLTEEHLLEFFRDTFQIVLDKQRLIKPDRQMMIDLLSKFADYLKIELEPIDIAACGGITIINHLDTFYRLANLTRAIGALLAQTNFKDFSTADIIAPKRKRNQKIFSQLIGLLINFYDIENRWLTEYDDHFKNFPAERSASMNRINAVRDQIEQVSSELNHLQKRYQPLKEQREILTTNYQFLEGLSKQLVEDKADCKSRVAEQQEAISEQEMQKAEIRNQIEIERLKIVSCPEKIAESVADKEDELNRIRDRYKTVRLETLELRNSLGELELNENELKRIQTLISEGNELSQSIESHIDEMQSMEEKFRQHDLRTDDLQLTCQNLEKHHSVLETDLQQCTNHHRTEMKPILLHNNRLRGVVDGKRNEYNTCKANKVDFGQLDDERALVRQKRDLIRQIHSTTQNKFNAFADEMNEVCAELEI